MAVRQAVEAGAGAAAASRELMWNMGTVTHVLMYALMVVSFVLFWFGLRARIRAWRAARPAGERTGDWGRRAWILIRETLLQRMTRERFLPGIFHSLIFYSFVVLFVTTLIVMVDMDFGIDIYHGPFYLGVTLAADLAGAFFLIGLAVAALRRYVWRPSFLPENKPADAVILSILAGLVVTGFLAEGARIRFHPEGDPWRAYSPVGSLVASLLGGLGPSGGRALHFATWWVHALGTFAMIALIPHTKFFHMLAIPTNQLLSKLAPKGSLQRVDIEALLSAEDAPEDFSIGVADASHLTWRQRLDLDACIECGRCDDACPARAAGQALSPRRLITETRDHLQKEERSRRRASRAAAGAATAGGAAAASAPAPDASAPAAEPIPVMGALGTVLAEEQFVWHCRTCHACQTHCPAAIEHVDLFMELRRAEVMMAGKIPGDAGRALKTMETQGNPFGAQAERMDFVTKLGIPVVGPGEETDVLLWIGCGITFDPQKHQIAEDMVAILRHLGVSFGHLGRDETCCGDPARVLGDENLFQSAAKQTIEALKSRRFGTLLVLCPHGYNVFKNEYPQFGGVFPVKHHSELLAEYLRAGRLRMASRVEATVAYHDPCYLGRYQGIFAAPREVLRAVPGLKLREMRHHHAESFCCGAGGGHFWMDIDAGPQRTYTLRVDEAVAAGAGEIAVGCVFCYQMLVDGVKGRDLDEKMAVVDVASYVRRGLGI